MNNHVQEIIDIEKRAQAIYKSAVEEAEKLPLTAEQQAQNLLDKSTQEAEEEADRLLEDAHSVKDVETILAQASEKAEQMKSLAMNHFDRAVGYILDQVAGRE